MDKIALSFYNGKKVFITGHTGFKGTWLCRTLLAAGAELTGYALEPPTSPSLYEQTGTGKEIHSRTGDVRDREALVQAVQETKPDILFHLAAQPLVRLSYREPALTYETNVLGTVNVLEALRLTPGIRSFVNVTTDKVYENKEWLWGYRENETLNGYDPYSNSKSCSELVTASYRNAFFLAADTPAVSTARSGNVIGGGDYAEDRIIPDCIRAVQSGKKVVLRNPHSVRPYQHVLECLSGYLLLAEKQYTDKAMEGAYNFGPDDNSCVTTGELAALFCAAWGQGAAWEVQGDGGPHEANFLKLDCAKAKAVLGWKSRWDIKTTVAQITAFAQAGNDDERRVCVDRQIQEYFK
ncbi:CDP-glucose 4,6-dehydratase [Treponema primitia]|uniref:CDP-glucose 4,6-dehydratase n=1 Tax=Treponema primitia TaxID=88058 RepID=UPI00025555FB|nr:CDP-glucose 4,6-dehydratase [Treponema primitia]